MSNLIERLNPILLLLARFGSSSMMMVHGFHKWEKLVAGGEIKFFDFIGMGPTVTLVLTILAELVAPVLIIVGLWTRYASALIAFTMFIAAFVVHAGDPLEDREASLTYLILFLLLMVTGAGRFSIDARMATKKAD
jgi:putative oxidoreductase